MAHLYILKGTNCPKQIYIGVTRNLATRFRFHNRKLVTHTSKFGPWKLVYSEFFETFEDALKRERQIKRWSRGKKEALICGDLVELRRLSRAGVGS